MMNQEKVNALANFLGCEVEEITEGYAENLYEYGNEEYLVLTEEEAEDRAKTDILDSLWAFNTDFILEHTNIDWNDRIEKAMKKMQEELCEDANEIVKAMITDLDEFVQDAIDTDGRGHFLSRYDGEENEEGEYFIYRTN
jgi:hypothetical protein